MPLRRHRLPSLITRLVLVSLAAVCLAVLRPVGRANPRVRALPARKRRSSLRRAAISLSFATLFFAGAAFSAGAGDLLVQAVEGQHAAVLSADDASPEDTECRSSRQSDWDAEDSTDGCVEQPDAAPSEQAAGEPAAEAPAETPAEAAPEVAPETASPESASPRTTAAIAEATGRVISSGAQAAEPALRPSLSNAVQNTANRAAPVRSDPAPAVIEAQSADHEHKHEVHPDPEVDLPGMAATVWLHRALPDPTPPSKRLSPSSVPTQRFPSASSATARTPPPSRPSFFVKLVN